MGILNITADSFYDGGHYQETVSAIRHCEKMLEAGAEIIDVGAVSSRPGADLLTTNEELTRLKKVLPELTKRFPDAVFSVDTFRSDVANFAADSGAHMINDISGGCFDEQMLHTTAKHKLAYVLMHMKGRPDNMQLNPTYNNVCSEIKSFFKQQSKKFLEAGNSADALVLDPGFGFGKTLEHNYQILNCLKNFTQDGFPVLAAVSRKSMINKLLNLKPEQALNGTSVLHTIALLHGASLLRVHDVKEAKEVAAIVKMLHHQMN